MKEPHDKDFAISSVGLSAFCGGGLVRARAFHPTARGFNSPHLHYLHRRGRQPAPVLQTRTTEAVESDTSILRSSACRNKEGHADEPTRRARIGTRQSRQDTPHR